MFRSPEHNDMITLIGDVLETPKTQQGQSNQGKPWMVARTRLGIIREGRSQQGQAPQYFKKSWSVSAWNDNANVLAQVPAGTTVMLRGTFENERVQGQNGQVSFFVNFKVFEIGVFGPSRYPAEAHQHQEPTQPGGAGGYGAPAGQPAGGGYGQPQPGGFGGPGSGQPGGGYPAQQAAAPGQYGGPAGGQPGGWHAGGPPAGAAAPAFDPNRPPF